jgi:thiosulfate/3-mercaptopyruvate sulfurtransferase
MPFSLHKLLILAAVSLISIGSQAQNPVNWTAKQLMEPSVLAKELGEKKELPLIISVGPSATIPGSIAIGMVNNKEGLAKLKNQLQSLPKEKRIVVYCGCCPFEHCPNVRPAIDALKQMKFTNYFLLNIPKNIRKDWIDKGYPVSKS